MMKHFHKVLVLASLALGAYCLLTPAEAIAAPPPFSNNAPTVTAAPDVTRVAMTDPAFLFSPYNWVVADTGASTVNSGAYFRILFSGTTCRLATETSQDIAPFTQFSARVDDGQWSQFTLAAGNPVFQVAAGLPAHWHLLEVVMKSSEERNDRWLKPQTLLSFTGLLLDKGAQVAAPARKPYNILVYGDSITEGCRTEGNGPDVDTNLADGRHAYSYLLTQNLPAEVGVVGFSWTALTHAGNGNLPILAKSWDLVYTGHPRSFTDPVPDLIIYNEATNDLVPVTDAFVQILKAVQQRAPRTKQVVLEPFAGIHVADLQAAVKQMNSPLVIYLSTDGFMNSKVDTVDGVHPYAYTHYAKLAPRLAASLYPVLPPTPLSAATAPTWR